MNLELLQNHIDSMLDTYDVPKLNADGSNVQDFFCADVIGGKKFVQNFGGYPRSDIAEINSQVNEQLQMSLLSQLTDFSNSNNPNAGLSDADIMLSHKSKYQQAPSEVQDWLYGQLQVRDAKRAQAIAKMQAAVAAKNSKSNSSAVVPAEPE